MSDNSNPFTDIQISLSGLIVTVQFSVSPAFTGRAPFTYNLLAYQDETFTEPLYSIPGQEFYIVDDTGVRQNQLPSYLYKVQLVTADNKTYYSNFVGWRPSDHVNRHKYLIASEIARKEQVRFNYAGLYVYLLKRKSYSPAQLNDVDPVTGEPIIDRSSSYGVGLTEGYYNPLLTRLSIEDRQVKTEFDEGGRGSQYTEILSTRMASFPFVDQFDIIVMGDGKRYTVIDANNKYFPGTTLILLQTPTLRLVSNTDTIYNIEVPSFPPNDY